MPSVQSMRPLLAMLTSALFLCGLARAQSTPTDQDVVRRAIHVLRFVPRGRGPSKTPAIPSLAGQQRDYVIAQLKDFRSQTRAEAGTRAYMWGISALLDNPTIFGLAEYYAALPPAPSAEPLSLIAAGRKIYMDGIPDRAVRACASCHGDSAEGAAGFPRLAGAACRPTCTPQPSSCSGSKLRPHGVVMKVETSFLKPTEMRAVAEYLQSL